MSRLNILACVLFACVACTGDAPVDAELTWYRDVRPLVERRCVGCHTNDGVAPFTFDSFARDVEPRQSRIVSSVLRRTMPPYPQDSDCRPAVGSLWLSEEELATFEQWREGGYEEGAFSDFVRPEVPPAPAVPDPNLVMRIDEGYVANVTRPDDYRCIPVGAPIDRDSWVTQVQVRPEQTDIVHHVIVFVVEEGGLDEMRALDESDEGPGWSCFGDAGLDAAAQIAGWVPGADLAEYQEDIASRVAAGGQVVVQMHYSVAGRSSVPRDHTEVALWRLPVGESPTWQVTSVPVADLSILIPAGNEESVHVSTRTHPIRGTVVGTSPHMHLLGTRLRTEVLRADGSVECLSGVSGWDFNWQRSYEFAEEYQVELGPEDRIRLSCTYDNSERNQPFVNGERMPSRDVRWGDGTRDEMCLDYLSVVTPAADGFATCANVAECTESCDPNDAMCAFACMGSSATSCLDCVLEEVFGPCAEAQCLGRLVDAAECLESCDDAEGDFFGCLGSECNTQTDALYECVRNAVASESCPGATAACPGWIL